MNIKNFIAITVFGLLVPMQFRAQENPDDITMKNDNFENHFYESLKQKSIENYDKAILEMQQCIQLQPSNAALYNELGKNYLSLKNYPEAQKAFDKAIELNPKERWYWNGLYDVFYETKDYNSSIRVVQKLIEFDKKFQDDLVSLYMYTQQFDKALFLIEEMEKTTGISSTLELYKMQIQGNSKQKRPQKEYLEEAIRKNPKDEQNYIELIYIYSENNEEEKALEVAKKLEKELPESDWAQVSLFKFHLNNQQGDKAAQAMNKVLKSRKVDSKIKHRILNEFLIFANNTNSFYTELNAATDYFTDTGDVNVNKEIGIFFLNKKKWDLAVQYLEKGLRMYKDDVTTIEVLLQAYTEKGAYDEVRKKATEAIELFPTQARLYYFAGMANNQMKNFTDALTFLKSGIDFVVDDTDLEMNFNIQLGEAYHGLGDQKNKEIHFKKAEQLLKQNK
ncbi:tetratricopeptide repeat protein [Flavobacterium sp.]|uniref:tetratricopeptide repeat protein n=1 Tax=Flavobacterium sp. TaxID=239 RepID=UPI0028BEE283|nr:tetratricopeptide repeat protein [Flavobacterium sp.]